MPRRFDSPINSRKQTQHRGLIQELVLVKECDHHRAESRRWRRCEEDLSSRTLCENAITPGHAISVASRYPPAAPVRHGSPHRTSEDHPAKRAAIGSAASKRSQLTDQRLSHLQPYSQENNAHSPR